MYNGIYISLKRNEARRSALIAHLTERGILDRYRWLEAVDGRAVAQDYPSTLKPGELGLWLSHIRLLEANSGATSHLHIIEDDTVLATNAVIALDAIIDHADVSPDGWDMIFTDVQLSQNDVELSRRFSRTVREFIPINKVTLMDMSELGFSATSSILINRQSVSKYARLLGDNWRTGPPLDIFIRSLIRQGLLKAFVTVPFQTTVTRESVQSDIVGAFDRSRTASTIYRRSLFQDADLKSLDAEMDEIIKDVQLSPWATIYAKLVIFNLGDDWQVF